MNCVSYTRTTHCFLPDIPENVITGQNERIREYIKNKGWKLTEKYSDRKKDVDCEEAFLKLKENGMARKFDVVVADSIFRFGRNVSMAEDLLYKIFYPAGIHFAIVEDDFCSLEHSEDEIKEYIIKKRNEYIGGRMTVNSRQRQLDGYYTVHDEKYGYLLNDDFKGFHIDEEVVPIIREIFQLSIDGMSYKKIATLMNERGIESPLIHNARKSKKKWSVSDAKWTDASIKRILCNTAYDGYWMKTINGVPTKVLIPPILETGIFEKEATLLNLRRSADHYNGIQQNPFAKRIFDKESGAPLVCRKYKGEKNRSEFRRDYFRSQFDGKRSIIDYQVVVDKFFEKLGNEKLFALDLLKQIQNGSCDDAKRRKHQMLSEKARRIIIQMNTVYRPYVIAQTDDPPTNMSIFSEMDRLDQQFDAIMKEMGYYDTLLSEKNPWIILFGNIELPDENIATNELVKSTTEKVMIVNYEEIEVVFKHSSWRNDLIKELVEMEI